MITEPTRDEQGKLIIENNTPDKKPHHLYRQKGGSLYYQEESGGAFDDGILIALEAAKQENCFVNYDTISLGVLSVNPEMNTTGALNFLACNMLIKQNHLDEKEKQIRRIRAQQNAPKSIGFEDFYLLDSFEQSKAEKIINFCNANDIYIPALKIHYDAAVKYAKSQGGSYEEQVKKATEHFGLPEVITQENLSELRNKLVLSKNDPRVVETQKMITQQHSRGKSVQNG